MTSKEIAENIGSSRQYVLKVWMEEGLKGKRHQSYLFNENYFNKPMNRKMAYIIGFIAADGCLYKRNGHIGQLRIVINKKDIEILEFINSEIANGSRKPPKINKTKLKRENKIYEYTALEFNSDILYNSLTSLGLMDRKTWIMDLREIFLSIGEEFFDDFIVGYFDGDGSISYRNGNNRPSNTYITFSMPKDNANFLIEYFNNHYGISPSFIKDKRKYKNEFGSVIFKNTKEKYIVSKILSSLPFSLSRKRERCLKLIHMVEKNATNRKQNRDAIDYWYFNTKNSIPHKISWNKQHLNKINTLTYQFRR